MTFFGACFLLVEERGRTFFLFSSIFYSNRRVVHSAISCSSKKPYYYFLYTHIFFSFFASPFSWEHLFLTDLWYIIASNRIFLCERESYKSHLPKKNLVKVIKSHYLTFEYASDRLYSADVGNSSLQKVFVNVCTTMVCCSFLYVNAKISFYTVDKNWNPKSKKGAKLLLIC